MTQPIDSQSNQPSRCSRGNTTRWRPNPTTGRWVARLILTCTLAVGCGGGVELGSESDGGPTTTRDVRAGGPTVPPTTATATSLPEPTSSTGPDLPEEATDVSDPPEATGRSDLPGVSVGFTDEEGWTYSAPMWPPTGVHSWSLDISSSPPGKARVSIDWDKGDTPLNVDLPPNNPGREGGPQVSVECCGLVYEVDEGIASRTEHFFGGGPVCWLTNDETLFEGNEYLYCAAQGNYNPVETADEHDQAAAQEMVNDMNGKEPVGWTFFMAGCQVYIPLDHSETGEWTTIDTAEECDGVTVDE